MLAKSYLFVPGDSPKKLEKIQDSGADAVIICLEDAVAEQNKSAARELTAAYLKKYQNKSKPQLWVRVNPIDSEHMLQDLVAVMAAGPYGIFFPKPSTVEDLQTIDHYLVAFEIQNALAQGSTQVMTLAESAIGAINQSSFVNLPARFRCFTWGAEDISADIGALTNKNDDGEHFLVHKMNRANCLLVSAAGDMQPVDGICADFKNEALLRRECQQARKEGFTGKLAIHPAQVDIINECFTPSKEELDWAKRVIDTFEQSGGAGTVSLDGKMLDLPHLKQAKRLMQSID